MAESSPYLPLLIAAGATIIGIIFFFVGRSLRQDERNLSHGLATVRAIIAKKYRKRGARTWGGLENYFIIARFTDSSGNPHEVELQVASRAWRMLREGGGVSLNHPPSQSTQVRFSSAFAYQMRRGLGSVLMTGGIAEALFFVGGCLFEFLREMR